MFTLLSKVPGIELSHLKLDSPPLSVDIGQFFQLGNLHPFHIAVGLVNRTRPDDHTFAGQTAVSKSVCAIRGDGRLLPRPFRQLLNPRRIGRIEKSIKQQLFLRGFYRYVDYDDAAPYLYDTTGRNHLFGFALGWNF